MGRKAKKWKKAHLLREVPTKSPEALRKLRGEIVREVQESEHFVLLRFTCDDCALGATCPFVFDPYNTDGDCLADK